MPDKQKEKQDDTMADEGAYFDQPCYTYLQILYDLITR